MLQIIKSMWCEYVTADKQHLKQHVQIVDRGIGNLCDYWVLKLENNDNLETMFLPIKLVFVIQILCTWCEYTTANKQCL